MPKKMSVYSKAEAARARKCTTEADRKELEAREKEEQYFSPKQKRSSTGAKPRVCRQAYMEEEEIDKAMKKLYKTANCVAVPVTKAAIAHMSVTDNLPADSHPERRVKAFFKLPKLKEEKPGLTHTQYKDMIWKLWKKSPGNPLNQQSL
ncbi:hypothetical protein ES288_A03G249600v1 [Gossypium darwinii]|uniref:Coiled-coil domain-containing protein n=1 Tax=Gossypium darwinii TaxID=34276 RepID=A0A5D2H828_GOSDA|nr:hypothetical protein ES288_A03G249600v1 [Gossypium darwinii]